MNYFDCIILGAGASGLMAAARIKGKKVLVLEGNERAGLKILASGGGLCNFYNAELSFKNYHGQNPRFCISALSSYTLADFKQFLKTHKVDFTQRADGKLFASSSKAVLLALLEEAENNAQIRLGLKVIKVEKKNELFEVHTQKEIFRAKNVLCALGSPCRPAFGATKTACEIAESFGHEIVPFYPALCGIEFIPPYKERFADTAGISLNAEVSCGGKSFSGGILFTHGGLSGPALFQLSLYGIKDKIIRINFAPERSAREFIAQNKNSTKTAASLFAPWLTPRLAKALLGDFDKRLADLNKQEILKITSAVQEFALPVKKLTGYDKAEIAAGGISVKEISSKTMESKKTEGLFFAGECLDISGQLGGYNLAWAWASAAAAASAINAK